MIKSIIKRSGTVVDFDISKIEKAVNKAFEATGEEGYTDVEKIVALMAIGQLRKDPTTVEDVQNAVEWALMKQGFYKTAKAYILYRKQHERIRENQQNLLDVKKQMEDYINASDWRVKENATVTMSVGGLILSNSGALTANYWLNEVYDEEIANAHKNGDMHIHDLSMLTGYCAGWSLKQLIQEGLGGVEGRITSAPASHLSTLCNQMVNFLGIMQNEWAGAQALSSFDTYLAPFVKKDNLTQKEVKQCIQSFVFGVNTPSRWGAQAPFSNITLDWTVPKDMANLPALVGGKEMPFTYGECQTEMDMINKAFIEIMIEGDANGRGFQYPIPTYSITKDFDWSNKENNQLLFEMTAKYGTPYFSNYINSDMEPSDVRSMCPLTPDTKVLVRIDGEKQILDIESIYNLKELKKIEVWTINGWCSGKPVKMPSTDTVTVFTENGSVTCMGINHLQPIANGCVHADELEVGMEIPVLEQSGLENPEKAYANGLMEPTYSKISKLDRQPAKHESLYCFEVANKDHIFMLANGVFTHNCRLRLDLRELRKKSGGYFGSGESTGSIGVVTIDLPRIAYTSHTPEEFYKKLAHMMDIAARSLDMKRKFVTKLMDQGMYPYTKRYLGSFDNHFSTIGLVGMNEAARNACWLQTNLTTPQGQAFAKEVLNFMRNRLSDYQEQYGGTLFNLEATPAESTTYRLAKHDVERYPNIITAAKNPDDAPYYTNSSHLPVGYTDDVFQALDLQDDLQTLYTSGTVFHAFLGERIPDWKSAAILVRKIAENYKLPYYTLSPTYSVCRDHGYIAGEHETCPICGKSCEVYSRITGYYRPLKNWNDGKAQEYKDRKVYHKPDDTSIPHSAPLPPREELKNEGQPADTKSENQKTLHPILISGKTCGKCILAEKLLAEVGFEVDKVFAEDNLDLVFQYEVKETPTLIVPHENGSYDKVVGPSDIRAYANSKI